MNVLEKILEEIKKLKYNQDSTNQDYITGYMSALSTVEGVTAGLVEAKDINVHSNDDWTPTEERQPEKPVFGEDSYIVQTNNIITPFSAFGDGEEWTDVSDDKVKGVIAWQTLPEPYKGANYNG